MVTITALNVYPVKSCKGIALETARLLTTGIEHDREWLIVRPNGQFITQREEPRLALVTTSLTDSALVLESPQAGTLTVPFDAAGTPVEVTCWRDRCAAFDAGETAAAWLEAHLGKPYRLVRFDPARKRLSSMEWTRGVEAPNQFSDGYPFLVISQASLDDLNARLPKALPMNRFRPNIVVDGLPAYGEDTVHEFSVDGITLRVAKPCARCAITTTDQVHGERDGEEPLRTLRGYRFSRELMGVLFGQNVILIRGSDHELRTGQRLDVMWKETAPA
ncbi:MAG TPA: MOSC N-terminal beta barrel domain-containing protein [Povalibacter sp.]|nr:MOSC N-terminal beta barrel domain-containing protein [Povalibacter sp.]